ncbi:hypothetical protein PILCRDRAFT_11275 [Piloderma croceum F 1598]|uniref:Uncharacterized protein n=1 Tax=Piloderma croceum (strain F 1598) TaxID=765440 RepID=A0A0C3BLT0_PILCF|nr:hypothetical protein PILCRDRAFT_11275 [Piloderma croceum F 1598]
MQPTYLNQHYLDLPQPSINKPYMVLPCPNAVDNWIYQNKDDAHTNVFVPGYLHLSDTPSDQVLCTVQISEVKMHPSDPPSRDFVAYNLILYVEVPENSGVNPAYLSSPLATLGRYEGMFYDKEAPTWVSCMAVGRPLMFRQPRGAMAEVFATIAHWTENASIPYLSKVMLEWAVANAIGTPAECKTFIPVTPKRTPSLLQKARP